MAQVSNAVILEKINGLDKKFDNKFDGLSTELREIKTEQKLNTEFRLKAYGIIGFVSMCCTTFGGFLVWLFTKFQEVKR